MMFLIATLLMNAGLLVFIDFGNYFENITKELNTSNVYYIVSNKVYSNEVDEYLDNCDNVIEYQKEEALWVFGEALYNGENRSNLYLISNASNERELSKWKFVGNHLQEDSMTVYLPYRYQLDSGYELDDTFELSVKNEKFTFKVKGFIEDVFFCSAETGATGIYLPNETYQYVLNKIDDNALATILFVNLDQISKEVETNIKKITGAESLLTSNSSVEEGNAMFSLDIDLVKMARVMMATMVALMIVTFAIIIAGVCLIVIRFRISNSIEEDMVKIGSLKAIGYTSKQIIASIVLQFFIIAIVGSLIGISLSHLTTPILSNVFAQQSGIKWEQGFNGLISVITLIFVLFVVYIVSLLSSRRIKKLHPIVALRGGLVTHSFRKNHLPLSTSIGNLQIVLALKNIFINLKQSFMMIIILITVSFSGTFAVVMFYNTTINTKTFLETPGIELSNIIVTLDNSKDNSILIENINKMSEVKKSQYIDNFLVFINEMEVYAFVMDDFNHKETNTLYQGRYPLHSNEVALSGYIANLENKKIGDLITLNIGDTEKEFLITGLTQGAFMSGMNISIRKDGMDNLDPNFIQKNLNIYINKGYSTEGLISKLQTLYGDSIITIRNVDKEMAMGASAYISIVEKVGIVMAIINVIIVILVLYFVINSSLIRKKREIGIQKAIGFTNIQLMNQMSLSFIFPIIIGVIIGVILGIVGTNPLMSIVQRGMGIMKANFIIENLWISLFGFIIIIISYLTSMLITYAIRKVSPYTLVSDN